MTQPAGQTAQRQGGDPGDPEVFRDDPGLILARQPGETDRLVICFSSIGSDESVPPQVEWHRLAWLTPRDHLLFVVDPARSWLNRPGLIEEVAAAIEAEAARVQAKHIVALGLSLGAYSALVMPGFTRIDAAVAFSPQIAVDPAVVPGETRWEGFRSRIAQFRIATVNDHIVPGCQYYLFIGDHSREAPQRALMRPQANVHCYVMPQTVHNTQVRLREKRLLNSAIAAGFARDTKTIDQMMWDKFACRRLPVPDAG